MLLDLGMQTGMLRWIDLIRAGTQYGDCSPTPGKTGFMGQTVDAQGHATGDSETQVG